MRKKLTALALIAATGAFSIMLTAPVYAQTTPAAPAAAPQSQQPQAQPQGNKTEDAGQFSARKQKLLENIGDHIARMQKKQSCIQAAVDEKALSACLSGGNETGQQSGENKTAPQLPGKQ